MFGELTFWQILGLFCFLAFGSGIMMVPMKKGRNFFDRFIFKESEESQKQTPQQ